MTQLFILKGDGLCEPHEDTQELIIQAGNYFLSQLMPRRKKLEIDISIMKELDDNAFGYTIHDTGNHFYVEIKEASTEDMLTTLAHELIQIGRAHV